MDPLTTAIATSLFSAFSIGGARRAAKDASKLQAAANRMLREGINLTQSELNRIDRIWGGAMESLGNYYSGNANRYAEFVSSPLVANKIRDSVATIEKSFADGLKGMTESLATLGITGSGIQASIQKETEHVSAQAQAKARADAPMTAAKELLGFAQVGEQARSSAVRSELAIRGSAASMLGSQATQQLGVAQDLSAQAGANITKAFDAWLDYKKSRKPQGVVA